MPRLNTVTVEVALTYGGVTVQQYQIQRRDSGVRGGKERIRCMLRRAVKQVRIPRQLRQAEPRVDKAPSLDGRMYWRSVAARRASEDLRMVGLGRAASPAHLPSLTSKGV
jgi:hypothetical protein